MKEGDKVKQLMLLYFGKNFSRAGRVLFGRWLHAARSLPEKDARMQTCWNQSVVDATSETHEDWVRLRNHLEKTQIVVQKPNSFLYKNWMKYAAVISLMLLTGTTTFFLHRIFGKTQLVEMTELFVPYGESCRVILPDSSQVWLNAGSLLVFPKDFTTMESRTVYLTGKASFTVRKNKEKPFIVKTTHIEVEALGTVFTVTSYPEDTYVSTMLEQGSILVAMKGNTPQSVILKPNERLVYTPMSHKATIQSVNSSLYKMEREGYQIYEDVSFHHLMSAIERRFNVTIHYNSQKYTDEYYNVKFAPHETLDDVLGVLQQLIGIQYKIKDKVVFVN